MIEVGNSCPVHSPQAGVHPALLSLLGRRSDCAWLRPLRAAPGWWSRVEALLEAGRPLHLDLGCGTGASTRALSTAAPDALVLGIDASIDRLSRTAAIPAGGHVQLAPNAWLLHGDSVDLVRRLTARAGQRIAQTWLLYPNPWPKPAHLARRWHAHPVFPTLLALSDTLELRCNWRPYAEEFVEASRWLGRHAALAALPATEPALSPFERKYRASGHALWQATVSAVAATP